MTLNKKRRAFVEHYLATWNAAEAARLAGYSVKTARQQGSRMLTNVDIQAAIKERIAELSMGADEVLLRLTEQARAEYAQFFKVVEIPPSDEYPTGIYDVTFDFEACQAAGKIHLVKQVKYDRNGNLEVQFYDAQTALVQIGRTHSLFKDRHDLTSGDEKIESDDILREDILRQLSRIADASETSEISSESDD
jgi:phage terminase small subunit